jgi:predicted DNA-binding WGR domain protein
MPTADTSAGQSTREVRGSVAVNFGTANEGNTEKINAGNRSASSVSATNNFTVADLVQSQPCGSIDISSFTIRPSYWEYETFSSITIFNCQTLIIPPNTTLTIKAPHILTNRSIIINDGTLIVNNVLNNIAGSSFTNRGTLILNNAYFSNNNGSNFANEGTINVNNSTIDIINSVGSNNSNIRINRGSYFNFKSGASFVNNGDIRTFHISYIELTGETDLPVTFTNNENGSLVNQGYINTVRNCTFTNNGFFATRSPSEIDPDYPDGLTLSLRGGPSVSIVNNGRIQEWVAVNLNLGGSFTNNGKIEIASYYTISNGVTYTNGSDGEIIVFNNGLFSMNYNTSTIPTFTNNGTINLPDIIFGCGEGLTASLRPINIPLVQQGEIQFYRNSANIMNSIVVQNSGNLPAELLGYIITGPGVPANTRITGYSTPFTSQPGSIYNNAIRLILSNALLSSSVPQNRIGSSNMYTIENYTDIIYDIYDIPLVQQGEIQFDDDGNGNINSILLQRPETLPSSPTSLVGYIVTGPGVPANTTITQYLTGFTSEPGSIYDNAIRLTLSNPLVSSSVPQNRIGSSNTYTIGSHLTVGTTVNGQCPEPTVRLLSDVAVFSYSQPYTHDYGPSGEIEKLLHVWTMTENNTISRNETLIISDENYNENIYYRLEINNSSILTNYGKIETIGTGSIYVTGGRFINETSGSVKLTELVFDGNPNATTAQFLNEGTIEIVKDPSSPTAGNGFINGSTGYIYDFARLSFNYSGGAPVSGTPTAYINNGIIQTAESVKFEFYGRFINSGDIKFSGTFFEMRPTFDGGVPSLTNTSDGVINIDGINTNFKYEVDNVLNDGDIYVSGGGSLSGSGGDTFLGRLINNGTINVANGLGDCITGNRNDYVNMTGTITTQCPPDPCFIKLNTIATLGDEMVYTLNANLVIKNCETLFIPGARTLIIPNGLSIINLEKINNLGLIINNGELTNKGLINSLGITNNGTFNNEDKGKITNLSAFTQNGVFNNDGSFFNLSDVINTGTFNNSNIFINNSECSFNNNDGIVNNSGRFTVRRLSNLNLKSGSFTNSGELINDGEIDMLKLYVDEPISNIGLLQQGEIQFYPVDTNIINTIVIQNPENLPAELIGLTVTGQGVPVNTTITGSQPDAVYTTTATRLTLSNTLIPNTIPTNRIGSSNTYTISGQHYGSSNLINNGRITNTYIFRMNEASILTNNGTINNSHTFRNNTVSVFNNFGSFYNNGNLANFHNNSASTLNNYPSALFRVSANSVFLNNYDSNSQVIEIYKNNTILFNNSNLFTIIGSFTNNAIVNNSNLILIESGVILVNNRIITSKSITNLGTITNNDTITLTNGGTTTNSGTITNNDTITNNGSLENSNIITNNDTITNNGNIINNENKQIINYSTIQNNNLITNNGILFNYTTLINSNKITNNISGVITNNSSFSNQANSTFLNNGGTFTNTATFEYNGLEFINYGTITNTIMAQMTFYQLTTFNNKYIFNNSGVIRSSFKVELTSGTFSNEPLGVLYIYNNGKINYSRSCFTNNGTLNISNTTSCCQQGYNLSNPITFNGTGKIGSDCPFVRQSNVCSTPNSRAIDFYKVAVGTPIVGRYRLIIDIIPPNVVLTIPQATSITLNRRVVVYGTLIANGGADSSVYEVGTNIFELTESGRIIIDNNVKWYRDSVLFRGSGTYSLSLPIIITANKDYNIILSTLGEGGHYTSEITPIVFTAPTTSQYVMYFGGVTTLYKVLSTSTRTTYITDSQSQTPNYFTYGNTISLTAGQKLYLMPKGSQGQILYIQISNNPPSLPRLGVNIDGFTCNVLGQGGRYYYIRPIRIYNGTYYTQRYVVQNVNNFNNIPIQFRRVISSTIPETAITDSSDVSDSGAYGFITLESNETAYIMVSTTVPAEMLLTASLA